MAEQLAGLVFPQLHLDRGIDNKGIFIVGNYGTGKSHLMSVIAGIAGIAERAELLPYRQNARMQQEAAAFAGRYKIIHMELGSVTRRLYYIITDQLAAFLSSESIDYQFPRLDEVGENKTALIQAMHLFNTKYPDHGLLLVVDELLDYLKAQDSAGRNLDFGFLRELGEVTELAPFRFMAGIQESLFDSPSFSFFAQAIQRIRARGCGVCCPDAPAGQDRRPDRLDYRTSAPVFCAVPSHGRPPHGICSPLSDPPSLPPRAFADSLTNNQQEAAHWRRFWATEGLPATASAYAAIPAALDRRWPPALDSRDTRALAIIVSDIDVMVHGATEGLAGFYAALRVWLDNQAPGAGLPWIETLIQALFDHDYQVVITSDHGHIEARGIGQPQEGVTVTTRSKRARLYSSAIFARNVQQGFSHTTLWTGDGLLPDALWVLMPKGAEAFAPPGVRVVSHGGITLDETIVPLIRIEQNHG